MPYHEPATLPGSTGLRTFGAWICAPGRTYGPYTWTVHQFVWVIDGSAMIRSGDEIFEVPPNAVFYTPPGLEYFITWDQRRATRIGYADFRPMTPGPLPRLRILAADDVVITLLNHLIWLATERPSDWMESARQAFDYALRAYASGHSPSRTGVEGLYSELVARATTTVQQRWRGGGMTGLSLDELAHELGVSTRQLSRAFAEELGVGPVTTFRMLRILEGARLLLETALAIREIAVLVGFANEFHFSRAFKLATGFPPAVYRTRAPALTRVPPQIVHFHQYQAAHFRQREVSGWDAELASLPQAPPISEPSQ